ncbi:MAG: NADH-quinone oxidoreductase subunit J [Acidimicrobiales bacterium]|nr:NADH-quinone oxidoreductase subunit J [Acidimicrobiales bacterium]
MVAQNIFFGIIAAAMVVSAIKVVTTKNVVHAALYLVIVLAGVAAQFILVGAEFTGVTQVLVYIGAVIVLFLFGIMLTRARIGHEMDVDNERRWIAGLTALLLFAVMTYALLDAFDDTDIEANGALAPQATQAVSDSIFRDYLIPFEAVSFLLLAALIGAIVVARRE